jgi:transposase
MNKFSRIDLHSNNSVVVVSDEADRVVYQRRLPNDPLQIRAALAPHREEFVGWPSKRRSTGTGWWMS